MLPELRTHTLLRVTGPEALQAAGPAWVENSLRRTPWVVIRRAMAPNDLVPVGVRGDSRVQRFASWVAKEAILECVTPQMLVSRRAWGSTARHRIIPALAALDVAAKIMREYHLDGCWGPGGSVGFELASGAVTATRNSDLDLIIQADIALSGEQALCLLGALSSLEVRTDVLLEMPQGAIALSEYARAQHGTAAFVLRTTRGPRLVRDVAEL